MRFMNNVKTVFLLSGLMGLCMLIGYFAGGPRGMFFGLMFGGIGNIVAYFYSDKIAIAAMRGQEVTRADLPWLIDLVERLAQRGGLPMPRVYVCPHEAPNAFATGRNPSNAAVAVTQGMLRHFPQEEIEGVLAHELAHVKHRDVLISTIAAVMAGVISYAGYMLLFFGGGRDREGGSPLGAIGAIAVVLLAPIAAGLIQAAISRQREFAADSYGGELCGDPRKLAGALRRLQAINERVPMKTNPAFNQMFIMEPLSAGDMASLFSTHPKTEERIAALMRQAAGR
ncbi:MAG: zinc metalloprotease HtpX [Phycisphaerae bacterium]|nr:zinc metalloprotease HtpX [Phycisphaerae bacterium]